MANHYQTLLTEGVAAKIMEVLAEGHYRTTAASAVGISYTTFANWMSKSGEPYESFRAKVLETEATAEREALAKIQVSREPADAKWYLARKFPDRWAETKRVDISGRLDVGMRLDPNALTDPTARAHIDGLTDWLYQQSTEPDPEGDEPTDGDGEP